MSKDIIFSIGEVFDADNSTGTLFKFGVQRYYIAPYQRGYKWASKRPDDPVQLLMKDLSEAAEADAAVYYLQFITVKSVSIRNTLVLEIIDGQQRLTTLTLLLSLLSHRLGNDRTALSDNKLMYEVRGTVTDFFQHCIYEKGISKLLSVSWSQFIEEHPNYNEQDIYYLFSAVKAINKALDEQAGEKKKGLSHFDRYLKERVKIIVNEVEAYTNCEEIFSNLNDNKIQLTSAELVKGLLLTQYARSAVTGHVRLSYRAILEIRALQGRQWDELAQWVNDDDIRSYFRFSDHNKMTGNTSAQMPMDQFISLFCRWKGWKAGADDPAQAEFNFLHGLIKTGSHTPKALFEDLKRLRFILSNWYADMHVYNYLGFLLHAEYTREWERKTLKNYFHLLESPLAEVRAALVQEVSNLLPDEEEVSSLEYGSDNKTIQNVLLALSALSREYRFDFVQYAAKEDQWSLEHIFPQKAEHIPDTILQKDRELICSVIGDPDREKFASWARDRNLPDPDILAENLKAKMDDKETTGVQLTKEEKELLSEIMKTGLMNRIGNMALLSRKDNSSNRDRMFNQKRRNIVERISKGSFVPKHTYDVFAKLLHPDLKPDLSVWTKEDIETHEKWIIYQIREIKTRNV